jgi:predicted alpha/beta hydrolase family esterase
MIKDFFGEVFLFEFMSIRCFNKVMKKVIFAHGKPPRERYDDPAMPKPHEANWFPWIRRQLSQFAIEVYIPALPKPYYPVFSDWKDAFPNHAIDTETSLVGFSAGSEFLIRLLSEDPALNPSALVLVAPWRDKAEKYGDFSEYTLDPSIPERVGRLTIISSLDDSQAIQDNAHLLAEVWPEANLLELDGYGHFMIGNNMSNEEFPELAAVLLGDQ